MDRTSDYRRFVYVYWLCFRIDFHTASSLEGALLVAYWWPFDTLRMEEMKMGTTYERIEALRSVVGKLVDANKMPPVMFELLDVAICGHMDENTKTRYIDDLDNRGTFGRLTDTFCEGGIK